MREQSAGRVVFVLLGWCEHHPADELDLLLVVVRTRSVGATIVAGMGRLWVMSRLLG